MPRTTKTTAAQFAARALHLRAEIAMTMLDKLSRLVLSYSSDAQPNDENWIELSEETDLLWHAVGDTMMDLFRCYEELADATGQR